MKINNEMLSRSLKEFGSKGGINRATNLTPKHRSKIAIKAATTRWQNNKEINKYENPRKTNG